MRFNEKNLVKSQEMTEIKWIWKISLGKPSNEKSKIVLFCSFCRPPQNSLGHTTIQNKYELSDQVTDLSDTTIN